MSILTDEQIEQIAKPFIRACGSHALHEDAIPERDVEDFARAIEAAVLEEFETAEAMACPFSTSYYAVASLTSTQTK